VLAGLLASGLLLAPGAFELRLAWDVPGRLPGGWRVGAAALHAAFSFAVLVFVGALIPMHMRAGLRRGRNVGTGLTLVVLFLALALTGLGIYYIGDEHASALISMTHLALGLLGCVPVAWHAIAGRRIGAEHISQGAEGASRVWVARTSNSH
jgi:hypothetical protein